MWTKKGLAFWRNFCEFIYTSIYTRLHVYLCSREFYCHSFCQEKKILALHVFVKTERRAFSHQRWHTASTSAVITQWHVVSRIIPCCFWTGFTGTVSVWITLSKSNFVLASQGRTDEIVGLFLGPDFPKRFPFCQSTLFLNLHNADVLCFLWGK